MTAYTLREKLAYSKAGKLLATVLRNCIYKNARIHWVQQALADIDFGSLRNYR